LFVVSFITLAIAKLLLLRTGHHDDSH